MYSKVYSGEATERRILLGITQLRNQDGSRSKKYNYKIDLSDYFNFEGTHYDEELSTLIPMQQLGPGIVADAGAGSDGVRVPSANECGPGAIYGKGAAGADGKGNKKEKPEKGVWNFNI